MRVAVIGARGQLGAAVVAEFTSGKHDVAAFGHADLDVTDAAAVRDAIQRIRTDVLVNCAAYNHVDAAEDHPFDALNVNALAVRTLAQCAEAAGAALVHFSTDFVFDGTASAPYAEEDRPNPRSVYAASKLVGEWFALDMPRGYVLRVESLFGRGDGARSAKGSLEVIKKAIAAGEPVRVFEDRTVSPTYVVDAARATRQLIETGAAPGIYHCVNSGASSWLDIAREIGRLLEVAPKLEPFKSTDITLRAARPVYCALSNEKLKKTGIVMPPWQDALAQYLARDSADHIANR